MPVFSIKLRYAKAEDQCARTASLATYASMLGRVAITTSSKSCGMQCVCRKRNAGFSSQVERWRQSWAKCTSEFQAFWLAFRSTSCAASSYTLVSGDLLLPTFPCWIGSDIHPPTEWTSVRLNKLDLPMAVHREIKEHGCSWLINAALAFLLKRAQS